jgi:serine phosphatase RsbU (regulator of sigma subunit)
MFQRTYRLLIDRQHALNQSQAAFEGKLAELEAANRVLTQRTRSIFAFQEIGQALTSFDDLNEMAERVCQRACDLCGAERAILYFLCSDTSVEVLAVTGWHPELLHQVFDKQTVMLRKGRGDPFSYPQPPPGVKMEEPIQANTIRIRAGLYVPLVSQGETVGAMIIHSSHKTQFVPGERALLRTLANQAALAIQRAGLITDLRKKITELEQAQEELREKERLERELELARQVQQNVLPKVFPEMQDYVIAARNEPASVIGGDFYDFIELDANHFGLAIGDVSGKGLSAALYMALTRSLLRAEARRQLSPVAVIRAVNQLLLEIGDPSMFVSLFYGVVDRTARMLCYARAGHDYPVLLRGEQVHFLRGSGAVLGILELVKSDLSEEQILIEQGDRLVLYTDGLTDLISGEGEQYDRNKLISLLQQKAALPLEVMCDDVFEFLHTYHAGVDPFDDMTIVVLQVK